MAVRAGPGRLWLDELAGAVTDYAGHAQPWPEYELRHRPTTPAAHWDTTSQPAAPDAARHPTSPQTHVPWLDAGPSNTDRATVSDIGIDERGAAVLHDRLQIVHAQLLDWIYPTSTGGGV